MVITFFGAIPIVVVYLDSLLAQRASILLLNPRFNTLRVKDVLDMAWHLANDRVANESFLADCALKSTLMGATDLNIGNSSGFWHHKVPTRYFVKAHLATVVWTLTKSTPASVAGALKRLKTTGDKTLFNLSDSIEPDCVKRPIT